MRASIATYNKIKIDPIWILVRNKEAYDGLDPAELNKLTQQFRAELIAALKGRFEIVDSAGPRVMRLSMALTNVETPSRLLAVTSTFLPVGLGISTISKLVTGEHTNIGSASMEILAIDSVSGKALFAAIDRHAGSKNLNNLVDPTSGAKEAFKWWANRLRHTLVETR